MAEELNDDRLSKVEKDVEDIYTNITDEKQDPKIKELDDTVGLILEELTATDNRLKKVETDLNDVYNYVTDPNNDIERKLGTHGDAVQESLESLSSINEGVARIGSSFKTIENIFAGLLEDKRVEEYKAEERATEARAPKAGIKDKGAVLEKGDSFSLLKNLLTNPAMIAAFSGLVYLFLPKDIKEKISGFFSGFISEAFKTTGELDNVQKALIASAAALTTFLGAKAIEKVFDAISTVVSLIKRAKTTFGALRKKGMKGLAKGAAVVGGLAATGAVAAEVLDEEEEPEAESKPSPASSAPTSGGAVGASAAPDTRPPVSGTALPSAPPGSAEDPMNADLNQYVKKKDSGVDLEGLHPNLKKRLAGMAKEYNEKTGKKIQINSAFRDPREQAELFAKIGPPKAAPPGRSKHEVGAAFDMNSGDADAAIQLGLFDKYGFTRPVRGETWHVEPVENRGGSFPDNPVSPGKPVIVASATGAVVPGSGTKVPASISKPNIVATPSTETTSMAELEPETTSLEMGSASTGTSVMASSEETEASYSKGKEAVIANSLDMSRQIVDKEGVPPPPPIPSPVADRSGLGGNLKHTTAYA